MRVFFYGLFMEKSLLEAKGLRPRDPETGFVDDFALRIGERATLTPAPGERAHGVVMTVTADEAAALYSEDSVSDYRPEPVTVELNTGGHVEAMCYNLPAEKISGTNKKYATALLELATKLAFPAAYLDELKVATE